LSEQPTLLLVNGPNLNRLGVREPGIYGHETLSDIVDRIRRLALDKGVRVIDMQSNSEGALIDFFQENAPAASGVILNPGAFAHYSYALRDCLADVAQSCPVLEVHISNVHRREAFRHESVLAAVVTGQIVGLGTRGYDLALDYLLLELSRAHSGTQTISKAENN
jgi:3-dehydroquinate dehydratase II